jgi:hypothetical protein
MTTDEDQLIAWLDGELAPADAEAFSAKVAGDPALAALAERHRALSRKLGEGFSPLLEDPAPAWLTEAITAVKPEPKIVDMVQRRAVVRLPPRWPARLAAAAALLLAIGVGWSLRSVSPAFVAPGAGGTLQARGGLAHALDVQLASAGQQGAIRIGLTFRARSGAICRTFEAGTLAGVACRDRAAWTIAEVSAIRSDQGQYHMAGETPAQMASVDELLAHGPFDAAVEARLAKAGWR